MHTVNRTQNPFQWIWCLSTSPYSNSVSAVDLFTVGGEASWESQLKL